MSETKKRLDWIDALRALAIVFVVFGHQLSQKGTPFFVMMTPVQMPLFFIISGYVFRDKNGHIASIAKYLVLRLLVPWFVLELVWLRAGLWIVRGTPERILEYLYQMLSGRANWYMICYIIASAILFLVYTFIKNQKARLCVLFGLGLTGLVLNYFGVAEFAKFNNALTVQIFLAMGILLKTYSDQILHLPVWTVIASAVGYVALGVVSCLCYPGVNMNVNQGEYYNHAISFGLILLGNYTLVRIFEGLFRIITIPKPVTVVGRYTLVVYLLHPYLIQALKIALNLVKIPMGGGYHVLWALVYTVWAVTLGTIIGMIANRLCPVLIGNPPRRRKHRASAEPTQ